MPGKEILYETFYLKAPGRDQLRRTAQGRLRHLLREGWHEMAREQLTAESIRIRFEREGVTKPLEPLRKNVEPPPRRRRDGRGGDQRGR